MVRRLVAWALDSLLIVIFAAVIGAAAGVHAFLNINVEAYPDPAPAIVEVIAQWPGASAEEMERQVTIPLEITLAGMPGLKSTLSKSLYGLTHIRNVFEYGADYDRAKQEVINRLQFTENLPPGVTPSISPASPIGEIFRYTIKTPKNALGQEIYSLNDIKALQDWYLEREFRKVKRIAAVTSSGGTIKRYEIQPDPERMKRFGITLNQLQSALANSNANAGGDVLNRGPMNLMVRSVGVFSAGLDPMVPTFAMKTPEDAVRHLRSEEAKRLREIRNVVITSINNVPIRVDDVVDGGPLLSSDAPSTKGVVVANHTRLGRVSLDHSLNPSGEDWHRVNEVVQGIVLMRKNEQSLPSLKGVKEKFAELSEPGKLPPGIELEPYYDRTELVNLTTNTVRHNLAAGIGLVTIILLMFLGNVRSSLIVAINIPIALMFAFLVLYWRGKSANLLSIGAVDFGIIVDSSVIMVENIYRHLCSSDQRDLSFKERVFKAASEIDKPLFFSTAIMVVGFIPLFTMSGAEGELFGPMAQTYAFALAGALLLALTLTPVLCVIFLRNVQPKPDNLLVRTIKRGFLSSLQFVLNNRWPALAVMAAIMVATIVFPIAHLGREFMPELEEGNLWIRATYPVHVSLDSVAAPNRQARMIIGSKNYPEVRTIVVQSGRPDDGTDPGGFNIAEFFVPLRPEAEWPVVERPNGERKVRTRQEIVEDMSSELDSKLPGVEFSFSQYIRDNVMEAISGVKGDNSVKIYGPDLARLEDLAEKTKKILMGVRGIEDVGVFHIMGQANLEFAVDKDKCKTWGVQVADVNMVVETAIKGKPLTQMVEGEKRFDVTIRWPRSRRDDLTSLLEIPVDINNNTLTPGSTPNVSQTPTVGGSAGVSSSGTANPNPAVGSALLAPYNAFLPRVPLKNLVSAVGIDGRPDPHSTDFIRPGGSMISREQGRRFIAVKFSVRDRDLASAVDEVREKLVNAEERAGERLFQAPYWYQMGGEFEQMGDAEARLLLIVPASLIGIFILLYLAFRSFLDAAVVLSNVAFCSTGGFWALYLLGINFSVSAAVGFVSLFGVAIMDGLLLFSFFNSLRYQGLTLNDSIIQGASMRVRSVLITDLAAILGLLPAAISTAIGSQTQRPLAIVVVGGMITSLCFTHYVLPIFYSFYGHREPPAGGSSMAH